MPYHSHRHNHHWSNSSSSSPTSTGGIPSSAPPKRPTPSPLSAPLSLSSSTSTSNNGSRSGTSSTPSSRLHGHHTPSRGSILQSHSPYTQPSTANEIIPRLFISDLAFAENSSLLSSYRITHILSVLPERVSNHGDSRPGEQRTRLQICVEDFPFAELAAHLPTTTKFIKDGLKSYNGEARVLVHCAEGISRSVSVVAAFLMAQYGWTPREAVEYVKERRKVANPNFGFVKQLYEYGRESLGKRGLVDGM